MSVPEHVTLAREAQAAGLIVTHLMPALYGDRFHVELWQPDGTLWMRGRGESAAMIRANIAHYPAHQKALAALRDRPGLHLVGAAHGQALACGCLATTTDTTKETS